MDARNFNFAPNFLPKWEFFCPRFCIFGRKFSNRKKVMADLKKIGGGQLPPSCHDATMPLLSDC